MRKGSHCAGIICLAFSLGVFISALDSALGVAWLRAWPLAVPWLFAVVLALLFLYVACRALCKSFDARARFALSVLPLLAALFGGIAWFTWHASEVRATSLPANLEGKYFVVEGIVHGIPRRDEIKTRLRLAPQRLQYAGRIVPHPTYILISDYNREARYEEGQRWHLLVRLRAPRGMRNAVGSDYETWLFTQRIGATGWVVKAAANRQLTGTSRALVARWRARIRDGIGTALGDARFAAIVKALAVGVRNGISEEQWTLLRRTGTAHLVAISGLHIGMAAAFGYLLAAGLWWVAVRYGYYLGAVGVQLAGARRWLLVLTGLSVAFFYAALAGFSLPTQRALLMLVVFSCARCLARQTALVHALCMALAAVLLWEPLSVLNLGFWLSFIAVASIALVLLTPRKKHAPLVLEEERTWLARAFFAWGRALRVATTVQLALLVAMLPALIVFFQQAPLMASLVNLALVPLYGMLVVPLVLAASVLLVCDIATPTAWLLMAAERGIALGWWLMEQVALFAPLQLHLPRPPPWVLLTAALGLALCLGARRLPGAPLALVLVVPLFLTAPPALPSGQVRITVLDVGQGLATVVQTQNHSLLYDTGVRYPSGFDVGRLVVVPNVRHLGVSRLDMLVISHGDIDHAGGVEAVREALHPRRILSGEAERFTGAAPCRAGQSWQWDGVRFTMLWPAAGAQHAFHANNNNRSCVLRVDGAHGSVLLTGDIEGAVEERLTRDAWPHLAARVLLAPHHGSATSSGRRFLQSVSPQHILISAGYHNRHGHPAANVLARYRRFNARVWNTAEDGAVTVHLAERIRVHRARAERPGFW